MRSRRFLCCCCIKNLGIKKRPWARQRRRVYPVDLIDYADGGYSIGRQVQSQLVQK